MSDLQLKSMDLPNDAQVLKLFPIWINCLGLASEQLDEYLRIAGLLELLL